MASKCLNKVQLIGNLTADPDYKTTSNSSNVCNFVVATNRYWTDSAGQQKEDTQFHRVVAWQKLAEICHQFLTKGKKVYVEGRMESHSYDDVSGTKRYVTETIADNIIILSPKNKQEEDSSSSF